jgi:predicted permease
MGALHRIANLFRRARLAREIDAELQAHIDLRTDDNLAQGMTPAAARRDAPLRFGNGAATRERVTAVDAVLTLSSMLGDIRYACRQLRKNPAFACTAILVFALGIGASVAIFAFVDAVLIKPLPYQNPARLVQLFESTPLGPRFHLSYLDYLDWRRLNSVFSSMEGYDDDALALMTPNGVENVSAATVSAGFFRTLGVTPFLGRDFRSGEDLAGAPYRVMLSYETWQNRYGKRPDVLGQVVVLEGVSYTIVGVLPPGFYFAPVGRAEFWTAFHIAPTPDSRGEHGMSAIARLKEGVSLGTASAEMNSIAQRLARQYPDSDQGRGATVLALTELIVGNLRPILFLLLAGSALLLLIVCVNVSSLLLIRSENRRQEIAVRHALGALLARVVRQFITESVTLAAAEAAISVTVAYVAIRLLTRLIPEGILSSMPFLRDLGLNAHVLCFAGILGLVTVFLFSIPPILLMPRSGLRTGLMQGSRGAVGRVWRQLGAKLVVLEICIAVILLVGAGLLGKSFYLLLHTDIGMQPDHLAVLRLSAPQRTYANDKEIISLANEAMTQVKRLPGVQAVAVSHHVPVAMGDLIGGNTTFQIVGRPGNGEGNEASSREISSTYFSTIQARLTRGRYFTEDDDVAKPRVMIINRSFARQYFPGEDPIGKRIRVDSDHPDVSIVGMVDDIKEGPLDGTSSPVFYTPFNQGADSVFYIVARTAQSPQVLLKDLEETVHRMDPNILTFNAYTMQDRIGFSQAAYLHRSSAWLVAGFASLALLLSVVGL